MFSTEVKMETTDCSQKLVPTSSLHGVKTQKPTIWTTNFTQKIVYHGVGLFWINGLSLYKPFTSTFACYNFKTLYIYIYSGFDHETNVVVRFKLEVTVAVFYNIRLTVFRLCSFTKQAKLCFEVESVLYQCYKTFAALEPHCSQRLLSCIHCV